MANAKPTYPYVKDALIATLKSGVGEGNVVTVFDCFPNPDDMKRECVVVSDTDVADTEWGPIGDHAQDEKYSIIVDFFVYKEDADPQRLRDRAFALYTRAQADLRADPTLGLVGTGENPAVKRMTVLLAWRGVEELPWDEGRVCCIRATARVTARI